MMLPNFSHRGSPRDAADRSNGRGAVPTIRRVSRVGLRVEPSAVFVDACADACAGRPLRLRYGVHVRVPVWEDRAYGGEMVITILRPRG